MASEITSSLTVRRDGDGRLTAQRGDEWVPVNLRPCFPWEKPNRWLSLRDKENEEVALVEDLAQLDGESRRALESALAEARFCLAITRVESIKRDFQLRVWNVDTEQGARRFAIKIDDWPYQMADGGLLVRDLSGDLYHVADPDKLDPASRKQIWPFTG